MTEIHIMQQKSISVNLSIPNYCFHVAKYKAILIKT